MMILNLTKSTFGTLFVMLILMSCAGTYTPLQPVYQKYSYDQPDTLNNVILAYRHNLLKDKYRLKELRKEVTVVAVKLTNNGDSTLRFGQHIQLADENGVPIELLDAITLYKTVKQTAATYWVYGLLLPLNIYRTETTYYGGTTTYVEVPIGAPIGGFLITYNFLRASTANGDFKNELYQYDLNGKNIKPGETVYGIVGMKKQVSKTLRLVVQNE
jgi:hypothetical protein